MPLTLPAHIIEFPHAANFYKIWLRGSAIVRIEKYVGDSEIRREVRYEELSEEVKRKILTFLQ